MQFLTVKFEISVKPVQKTSTLQFKNLKTVERTKF